MADEAGIPTVYLEHQLSHEPKVKKPVPLIDKLRHKMSSSRSWMSSIHSVRTAVAERRSQNEALDVAPVQNCLDKMQKAIKVLSAQTLKERLDLIGRQLGLNTDIGDKKISLGMDAFFIEIRLSDSGELLDVKLSIQGDVVDCPDLKDILKKGDFTEFVEHLQGLQSIYQVTSDEKLKSKAFIALQSLEKDLNQLAQFQSSISGVANYIHKCPLGVMLPRMAGKPMKLIYFVSPYDLLDKRSLTAHPLTVEAITDNFLGQSVTVCIEAVGESSPSNKLQTMPLMTVSKTADGKSLPSFSSWSSMNSTMLPASFVLVLPQSIPVSTHLIQKITALTNLEIHKDGKVKSLQSLILESFSNCPNNTNRLLVSLPDQHHVYILNGLNGGSQDQQGVMVSRIPFTHPTHVPKILNHLRQQLLFNIIVSSCIRPDSKKETSDSIVFEVNAVSLQQLTIAFEHPAYDSLITVDIDLSDITSLKCQVSCTNPDHLMCSDENISRVFQRCMSIPIMLRWLIRKGRSHLAKLKEAALAEEKERLEKALLQKEMQQRQAKMQASILPTKSRPPPQPPHPPPLPPPPSYPVQQQQQHHSSPHMITKGQTTVNNGQPPHIMPSMMDESRNSMIPSLEGFRTLTSDSNNSHLLNNERSLLSPESDKAFTPALSTSSLEEEKGNTTSNNQSDINDSPMLTRLLDDNTSVATNIIPMNCKPNPPQTTTTTTKRQRKRKSQSDFNAPPAIPAKQRLTSDSSNDSVDRLSSMGCSMDMDIGGVGMDPTTFNPAMTMGMPSMSSPHGHHPTTHHPMLNHAAVRSQTPGNVIDLTEEESSLKKLADSVDSLDKRFTRNKDMKAESDISMLLYESDNSMSRIPNSVQNVQNSSQNSKNENASTSLEGFLKGSGEVGRANSYDPADAGNVTPTSCSFSKLSSLLLAPSDGPPITTGVKHQLMNSSFQPDKVRSIGEGKTTVNHAMMHDVKPKIKPPAMNVLQKSSSVDFPLPVESQPSVPSILDKFDQSKLVKQEQQQQSPMIKPEVQDKESGVPLAEGRVSLKFTLKQQNNLKTLTKQSNSVDEADLYSSKLDNTGTFDFKSDEDEDDTPIMSRYVCSSSPTRLQISTNKQKKSSESSVEVKVEKLKKKEKNSTNSTKRKKEKEESRREKKRKKTEHNIVSESVYRTVENEEKNEIPKLKIRVAKKTVTDKNDKSEFSEFTEQSYEISKKLSESPRETKVISRQQIESPGEGKVLTCKQVTEDLSVPVIDLLKEKETDVASPQAAIPKPSLQKSSIKSGGSTKSSSGGTLNSKTDPKLVTKATIRLKPLMLNSGTTVSITQSTPKSAGSTTAGSMKMDKRSSSTSLSTEKRTGSQSSLDRRTSVSGLHERRNQSSVSSSSSSTTVSVNPPVTTTAKLSLSSILPNAPTVSKIASLPRIPKLSSSSNASINRTSSLDPAAGTTPSPSSGSKSNNSYNTAGRHNTVSPSGPGPGGGRGAFGNNSSFNYNNRMAPPGSWNNRPTLPFNNRSSMGPQHRQPSPMGNNSMRPSGHRQTGPHSNTSVGGKLAGGNNKTNTSSSPSSILKNNNGSSNSNFNNNTNITQKSFGNSGAKVNNNINPHAKMSNVNSAGANMKTSPASYSNSSSVQRLNSSQSNSVRSQSSITKSPNTAGVGQSPNACHSPSVTGSNRSPSLNSASKSPNFSSSSGKSPNLNRSPSLTSSPNINRSPNISNPNRSPNVQSASSSNRSSISMSSSSSRKSPLTVPIKSVQGASKSSPILKSTPNSSLYMSPSSQKHPGGQTTSVTTTKPSILKNAMRPSSEMTSVTSAHSQPTTIASVSQSHGGNKHVVSTPGSTSKKPHNVTSISSTTSSLHQPSAQSLSSSVVTSVARNSSMRVTSSNTKSVTSSISVDSKSISVGQKKSNNGNVSSHEESSSLSGSGSDVTTATSFSSGPDGKSKGNIPAVRGRKNSLSAIVDKLKHNAVGAGLDLTSAKSNNTSQSLDSNEVSDRTQSDSRAVLLSANEKSKSFESSHQTSFHSVTNKSIPHGNLDPSNKSQKPQISEKQSSLNSSSKTCNKEEAFKCNSKKGDNVNASVTEDSNCSFDNVKHKSRSSTVSPLPVVSPSSNPSFPSHQSPLSRSRTPSPSMALSKSNGESPSMSQLNKDRIFKVPSIKDLEERTSSPDLGRSPDINKANRFFDKNSDYNAIMIPQSNTMKPVVPNSDRKISKSVESPLSDISSPDNDLVIDDESVRPTGKLLTNKSNLLNTNKNSMCHSPVPKLIHPNLNLMSDKMGETSISRINTPPVGSSDRIPPSSPLEIIASSPQTGNNSRPPSALSTKSPAYSRTHSGASTPKGSDSPFEIDDDLMDVALGCDS